MPQSVPLDLFFGTGWQRSCVSLPGLPQHLGYSVSKHTKIKTGRGWHDFYTLATDEDSCFCLENAIYLLLNGESVVKYQTFTFPPLLAQYFSAIKGCDIPKLSLASATWTFLSLLSTIPSSHERSLVRCLQLEHFKRPKSIKNCT